MINQSGIKELEELTYFSKKVVENKLAAGPGGNTSIRYNEIMYISPSGYSLDECGLDDWVPVDIPTGKVLSDRLRPSSEVSMHLAIYRSRQDVHSIFHTHPPITIGIISTGLNEIPPMFPDYVALVGKVPFIKYVVPCSETLAQEVQQVLKDEVYKALFLKNHGLITLGTNVKQAYVRTELIEEAAKIFWVSSSVGTPRILNENDIKEIVSNEAEIFRQKLMDGEV